MDSEKKVKSSNRHKTNAFEHSKRIDMVYQLLIQCARRGEILRFASEQGWGVSERQVEYYITEATRQLTTFTEKERQATLKANRRRREFILGRNLREKNDGLALDVLKDYDKVMGGYPEERHKHTVDGNMNIETDVSLDLKDVPMEILKSYIVKKANG